jgi:hypothetical protein
LVCNGNWSFDLREAEWITYPWVGVPTPTHVFARSGGEAFQTQWRRARVAESAQKDHLVDADSNREIYRLSDRQILLVLVGQQADQVIEFTHGLADSDTLNILLSLRLDTQRPENCLTPISVAEQRAISQAGKAQ